MRAMKTSEEFTSPASFLKKQSHIISNNTSPQDYYPFTPTSRNDIDKEMHRSHFHSQVNNTKQVEDVYFDQPDAIDKYSEGKDICKEEETISNKNIGLAQVSRQPYESFYQSDELSSEQSNSQTKSHKKFGLSQYNLSEKVIRRVTSNKGDDKFLIIDSKKQKYNNKYLTLGDVEALKQELKKYQISIDKLKEENLKLRSQKIKLSSTNQSMQLIQYRLQLESMKKRVKQLQTEKQMHLTIDPKTQQNVTNSPVSSSPVVQQNQLQNSMTVSCLQNNSTRSDKEEAVKRTIPTFRNNQGKQIIVIKGVKEVNSPRNRLSDQDNTVQSYKTLQNMKSPYFLKKN